MNSKNNKNLKSILDPEIQKRMIHINADELETINKKMYEKFREQIKGHKNDRNK